MHQPLRDNSGVAIVEMALIATLFFVLLTGIFDFVSGYRTYSLATHALMNIARRESITRGACASIRAQHQQAERSLSVGFAAESSRYGINPGAYTFSANEDLGTLTLNAGIPFRCIVCKLVPRGFTVTASTQVRYEECP